MARFFGENSLGARDMMIGRSRYNINALTLLHKVNGPTLETLQIKDFQKDEKILVGRVDASFNPIFLNPQYLKTFVGTPGHYRALNCVVDAYRVMKITYDHALRTGRISLDSPSLSEFTIKKAYTDPTKQYNSYIKRKREDFKKFVKSRGRIKKISDFDSFVEVFLEYVEETAEDAPFTKSMYFLTNRFSPLTSGLAFEIAEGDYGDDQFKVNNFYRDRNFEFLKNLTYAHGFVIDKHIPWRIIADLNSPMMQTFIKLNYGLPLGAPLVLTVAYNKMYGDDVISFVRMMVSFYNMIARHRPQTVLREPGPTSSPHSAKGIFRACVRRTRTINRRPTTFEEVRARYPDDFWLDKYIRVRNVETGMSYNEALLETVIKNASDLSNSLDNASAMRYIVSKFDNVEHFEGSQFYDTVRLDLSQSDDIIEEDVAETVLRSVQASNFVIY